MDNPLKGYLLAFLSVIAVSNVYIFSKAALNEISLAQFGTYWFGFGLIWIILYGIKKKSFQHLRSFDKSKYTLLITLGFIEIVATTFFFKAIHTIPNPAITSFLNNISPVFVLSLSFLVLGERLNRLEIMGVFLALSGGFIIGYKGGFDIRHMFIDGTQYVVMASIMFAISSVISKKNIVSLSPVLIAFNRTLFLFIFSLIVLLYQKDTFHISSSAFTSTFIGSILGPFLTVITGLQSLKYIDLSKKSMISSMKSLFILVGAYLYFDTFPKPFELMGGLLSIMGVLLIIFGKKRLKLKESKK